MRPENHTENVILTLHQYDVTATNELDYSDATVDDILNIFVGAMVTLTYDKDGVLEAMARYAAEHLDIERFKQISSEEIGMLDTNNPYER